MDKYIKLEDAMKLCEEFYWSEETCSVKGLYESAPSIEIVKCGECGEWGRNPSTPSRGWCYIHEKHTPPDYYCADGTNGTDWGE